MEGEAQRNPYPYFIYRRLTLFLSKRYMKRYTASPVVDTCIGYPYVLYRRSPLKRGCRIHQKIHAMKRTLRALPMLCASTCPTPCCGEGYASMLLATSSLVCRSAPPHMLGIPPSGYGLAAMRLYVVSEECMIVVDRLKHKVCREVPLSPLIKE